MQSILSHHEDRERRLDDAVIEWLKFAENGDTPDPQAWLDRYPDLAPELAEFLSDQERLAVFALPLASGIPSTPRVGGGDPSAETIGQPTDRTLNSHASTGRAFGEYELVEEIARGGMGVVYKARQTRLNRTVAVKMILAGQLAGHDDVQRFLAEAEAAAGLDHAGIVPVYECGQIEGQHFFSMGFVDGQSLAVLLAAGPLPPRQGAELLAQVADAVAYAHNEGVIHRDLKPGNILLDKDGHPRVTDFGLAKKVTGDSGLTHTGQAIGTPSYMPPEQAAGNLAQIGPASDIYALGAVLYALLTGRPPFHAASPLDTLRQVLEQEPVAPRKLNPQVPIDLETIALKCLQKEPYKRYASAHELADELRRFLADVPIRARRASQIERLRRWSRRNKPLAASLAAVGMLLICVALGAGIAAAYFRQQKEIESALARDNGELASKYETAAKNAEAARRQAETTLADMQTTQGLLAAERGDAGTALLWFANAAERTPHDQDRQRENRLRAKNWLSQATLPIAAIELGQPAKLVEFQPQQSRVLALGTQGRCFIWDCRDDVPLPWTEKLGNVSAACWSPDGFRIATAFTSGEVQIRDTVSGEIVVRVDHPNEPNVVVFSPDGCRLAIGSKLVQLWRIDGKPILEQSWPHPQAVYSLIFDSAGERLVTSCHDKLVRVYSVTPAQGGHAPLNAPLAHDPKKLGPPALLKNDRCLVTIVKRTAAPRLGWWDSETGRNSPSNIFDLPALSFFDLVVSSADGLRLAVFGDHSFKVWNVASSPIHSFVGKHRNAIEDLRFSPDGTMILSVSGDQTAQLWSLADGRAIGPPLRHTQVVSHGGFSSDGRQLFTAQSGGLIRVWERPEVGNSAASAVEWQVAAPVRPRISLDGKLAVAGIPHEFPYPVIHCGTNQLNVLNLETGKLAGPPIHLIGFLIDACVCADQRKVAAVSAAQDAGSFTVRNPFNGKTIVASKPLPSPPCSIDARPHSSEVAILCRGGELLVLDDGNGEARLTLAHLPGQGQRARIAYTPDGSTLVVVTDNDNSVLVYDAQTGQRRGSAIQPVLRDGPLRSIDLSADSKWLATAVNGRNAVQVWDLSNGRAQSKPLLHPGDQFGLFAVRFSPDGRHLLSASKDGQARYWDWQKGRLACPPLKHEDEVFDVAFSQDGRHAVTISRDGITRIWELVTGKLVAPPMALSYSLNTIASARDRILVSDGARGSCFALNLARLLSEPELTNGHLQMLGELATGQRIEIGDLSALRSPEWTARWHQARDRITAADLVRSLAKRLDEESDPQARQTIVRRAARSPRLLDQLASLRPDEPLLHAALAREADENGDPARARVHRVTVQRLYEKRLTDQPKNEAIATQLAAALLDLCEPWTRLKPRSMKSQAGAAMTRLPDDSILVSGVRPKNDTYTIEGEIPLAAFAALKLETLPHVSLAGNGPGRASRGEFVLTDVRAKISSAERAALEQPQFSLAWGPYSQTGFPVAHAVDDKPATGWAVWPRFGQAHPAVFQLAEPIQPEPRACMTITLGFDSAYAQHQLGHFRLSVADRPVALLIEYIRSAIEGGELRGFGALGAAYAVCEEDGNAQKYLLQAATAVRATPFEHLLLALAQSRLGDKAAARTSYDKAVAVLAKRCMNDVVYALARWAAVDVGAHTSEEADKAIAALKQAAELATLTSEIEREPATSQRRRARGEYFARHARWKEAADDWREILRLEPANELLWLETAALLAAAADRDDYRKLCRDMLSRFGATQDVLAADKISKACLLLPDATDAPHLVGELAKRCVSLGAKSPWRPVLQVTQALADFRSGDLQAASEQLKAIQPGLLPPEYRASYHIVSSLVAHRQGDVATARSQLAKGGDLIRAAVPNFSMPGIFNLNWLIAEVFRREAEASLAEVHQ